MPDQSSNQLPTIVVVTALLTGGGSVGIDRLLGSRPIPIGSEIAQLRKEVRDLTGIIKEVQRNQQALRCLVTKSTSSDCRMILWMGQSEQ